MPVAKTLNPNAISLFLNKDPEEFTKEDIIRYVVENEIKMMNFRYIGGDGRVKTLNFILNGLSHLDEVLSIGERVDGSSLFSYVDPSSSDLYVIPRYSTAFVNPFSEVPTIDLLCSFFTPKGVPMESSPEYILTKATRLLKEKTGYELQALGELEYYLFSEQDSIYPITQQKGYHESHPFSKWAIVREQAMKVISEMGGKIKYGHSEVGNIVHNGIQMVQHEIEFLPTNALQAADQLALSKWVIREIAYKHGLEVSFAPKIIVGHAGSGLHFHLRLVKGQTNAMVENGALSDTAKKMIAGMLEFAPSLTAFGNTVPTSYLRLVPHQEAPTKICWGDRNRSVLVRVPLGWLGVDDMLYQVNPQQPRKSSHFMQKQTVEIRSADGSADIHQFLAGVAIAALYGLENPESLKKAQALYSPKDASAQKDFQHLPTSCYESAQHLKRQREGYERDGIFPASLIDSKIKDLESFDDCELNDRLLANPDEFKAMVNKYIHCG